jgi:SAM-dependent methyltransferase
LPQSVRQRLGRMLTVLRLWPPRGLVRWGGLRRLSPLSVQWGFDRGQPIDRYYIERYLSAHAADIRGQVLEIDTDTYTCAFGGDRVENAHVLRLRPGPGATIVADLAAGDEIPSDAFDCVILTQTLQLIFDVDSALATAHRILKPGGILLLTVPGLSKTRDANWHFQWLFTSASLRRCLEAVFGSSQVEVEAVGNVLAAIAFLHGVAVEELSTAELEYRDPDYEVLLLARATKPTTST